MDKLKSKRAAEKAVCTKVCSSLDSELKARLPDCNQIRSNIVILESKLTKIDSYTDLIIDYITDPDEVIAEKTKDVEYETKIRLNIAIANSYLQSVIATAARTAASASSSSSASVINQNGQTVNDAKVKLPQIILSKFDDSIVGWSSFWDNFNGAVNNRQDLTPSQKFTYLRGQLQGDALTLIERLPVDDANYPIAVNLLKETYDNKVIGIINQIDHFQSLKVAAYNLASVRKFRAEFESVIASLEILDCKIKGIKSAESILIAFILNKLPSSMRDNLMRTAGKQILELDKFREALKIELDLLCSTSSVKPKVQSVKNSGNFNKVNSVHDQVESSISTAGTFSVVTDKANSNAKNNSKFKFKSKNKIPYCHFCDDNGHTSGDCAKYPDYYSRMKRLRSMNNRCNTCWFRSHGNQQCANLVCRLCKGNHWTAICDKKVSKGNSTATSVVSANVCERNMGSVALPTFSAPLVVGKSSYSIRCLLDQCSQRTLVLRSLVTRFSITMIGKESLVISGYGSSNTDEEKTYDIAKFDLMVPGTRSTIPITAIVVDDLPHVTIQGIESVVSDLKEFNVDLADRNLNCSLIDDVSVLIGGDFYYHVVLTNKLPRCINNVWLLPTLFGECIVGKLPLDVGKSYSSNCVTVLRVGVQEGSLWQDSTQSDGNSSVDKLWALDNIGILDLSSDTTNQEILDRFYKSVSYQNGQYHVSFPWKEFPPVLPSNFALAKGRLNSLLRKLDKDP